MSITAKFQEELKQAKNNLKVAESCELIIESYNNKSKFEFTKFSGGLCTLFSDKLMDYSKLQINSSDVKNYIEMYQIVNDIKPSKEIFEILKAVKIIEKNNDLSFEILEKNVVNFK